MEGGKEEEQGRIHGYLSRVRFGRGSNESLQALKQQNTRSKIRCNGPRDLYLARVSSCVPKGVIGDVCHYCFSTICSLTARSGF